MGGHDCKRSDLPIGLAKQEIEGLNIYGEPIGQITVGISIGQVTYRSKTRIWKIETRFEKSFSYTETNLDTESRNGNIPLRNVTGNNPVTEIDSIRKSRTEISRTGNSQDLYIDDLDNNLYIDTDLDNDLDNDLDAGMPIGSETGPDMYRTYGNEDLRLQACDYDDYEERVGTSSGPLALFQNEKAFMQVMKQ